MLATKEGGFIGTSESAERKREQYLKNLPDIPYLSSSDTKYFVSIGGGQWDGSSFCGTNPDYPDGNCTHNELEGIQKSFNASNQPLFIPKKDWKEEWTPIQIEAFAKQNIQVKKRTKETIRGKKYLPIPYYSYNLIGSGRGGVSYYQRWKKEQQPLLLPTPTQSPPMVTPAVSIAGTTAPPTPTPTPTPSRISVFPFVIIGILAIVFIIIWRGRK